MSVSPERDKFTKDVAKQMATLIIAAGGLGIFGRAALQPALIPWRKQREDYDSPRYSGYRLPMRFRINREEEEKTANCKDSKEAGEDIDITSGVFLPTLINIFYKNPYVKEAETKNLLVRGRDAFADVIHKVLMGGGKNYWGGLNARHTMTVPAWGVGVPAAVATLLGGYGVTDAVLKRVRERAEREEVNASKREYERLLNQAMQVKKQGNVLDMLAEARTNSVVNNQLQTKEAQSGVHTDFLRGKPLPATATPAQTALWKAANPIASETSAWNPANWSGPLVSTAIIYALLTSYGTGKWMYETKKKKTKYDIYEDAKRIRSMRDVHGTGVPLYIPYEDQEEDLTYV